MIRVVVEFDDEGYRELQENPGLMTLDVVSMVEEALDDAGYEMFVQVKEEPGK
jgi:hypothetical protein